MSIRILQIVLMAAALTIAVVTPCFNGLSLLGLAFLALTAYLAHRYGARKPSA